MQASTRFMVRVIPYLIGYEDAEVMEPANNIDFPRKFVLGVYTSTPTGYK